MRSPKFLGVYSTKASRKGKGRPFYFVWQLENAGYAVQELDQAFMPVARPRLLSSSQLQKTLRLEPGILAAPISTPDFRQLRAPATEPAEATELTDVALEELERARRARQVENDMRNSFDKAMRALNRPRDRKGALAALEHLAETTEGIVPAHKHMFRDFGVSLRRKSLPELALACARRALELSPNDDHAHFNMARLLGILGLYDQAFAHLRTAMKIDSREPVYPRLMDWLSQEQAKKRG